MTEFQVKDFTFRIKKMNAVQLLAFQSQISFDSMKEAMTAYETMLEYIEVKIKDNWIQVKQGNNYYPAGIEDDLTIIKSLVSEMIKYIKSVFQSSDELK